MSGTGLTADMTIGQWNSVAEKESGEAFGNVAGSSPRVPSNTPSIRDEHQPSITLSDCPPDTVQMVGLQRDYSGSDGQKLHYSCLGNNQSKLLENQIKVLEKGGGKRKILEEGRALRQSLERTEAKEE